MPPRRVRHRGSGAQRGPSGARRSRRNLGAVTTHSDPFAGFGPNEWLVYEMYQQYLKDPESVDKAWWDFFADYQPADTGSGSGSSASPAATKSNGSAEKPVSELPKAPAASTAPPKEKDAEKASPKPTKSAGAPTDRASAVGSNGATERGTSEGESASQARREPSGAPATQPLRGAAARVVSNMEASLAVPTATSVRAIPAKLLIDNRVVINNHLRRGRGGKVSFTHPIGFAL